MSACVEIVRALRRHERRAVCLCGAWLGGRVLGSVYSKGPAIGPMRPDLYRTVEPASCSLPSHDEVAAASAAAQGAGRRICCVDMEYYAGVMGVCGAVRALSLIHI